MGKIGPFVGKDETIGPVVRIGPFVGIGLFGGTGPVVSLTNIIRDMVMQLNFIYLPKTGQHSKDMVASQTSWL